MTLVLEAAPLVVVANRQASIGLRIEALLRDEPGELVIPAPVTAEVDDLLGRRSRNAHNDGAQIWRSGHRSRRDDPLGRLAGHSGNPIEVRVVVEHGESMFLASRGNEQVWDLPPALVLLGE